MIVVLSTFLVLLAVPSFAQDSQDSTPLSPCPSVFTYDLSSSVPGRWDGVINLSTNSTLNSLWLNILFDDKVDILGPLCGKLATSRLLQNGKDSVGTLWPWQIALHQTLDGIDRYICGGTLVTARHVITAAHCVTMKSSSAVVDRHTLAVFLGKSNLYTSTEGVQIGFVKQIKVHPDYDVSTYKHNVAILELNQPLKYSDWVRPACLWPKNETDLKKVIGNKGMLIGWRYDDKGDVINDLSEEAMPVISQAMCIMSHERLRQFTSQYTYCAGNRNEKSSCVSGGSGMVMMRGSTWYLRGLVSLGIPGHGRKKCDPRHYLVFTDLAKILPWIYNNVFDF